MDRIPPHDTEAELSVLGCMLVDNAAITIVQPVLKAGADTFYHGANQEIYKAILHLHVQRGAVDLILLREHLQAAQLLSKIGGIEYLFRISETESSAGNVEHYAHLVFEKWQRREAILAARAIEKTAFSDKDVSDELITSATHLTEIAASPTAKIIPISHSLNNVMAEMDAKIPPGIPTGYKDLDEALMGIRPTFTIVAARPGVGKTALAKNIALRVAKAGGHVMFFSLEDVESTITKDLIAIESGLNTYVVYDGGRRTDEHMEAITKSHATLYDLPIFYSTDSELTAAQIRAHVARHTALYRKPALVIVDYVQLIKRPGIRKGFEELGEISRQLRAMANEFMVPVWGLSQINRQGEFHKDKRPSLGQLRESGSLEQDARVVLLLFRESMYWDDTNEKKHGILFGHVRDKMECYVAKNSVGRAGSTILFSFHQPSLQINGWHSGHEPEHPPASESKRPDPGF